MDDTPPPPRRTLSHVWRVALSLLAFALLVAGATGVVTLLVSAVTRLTRGG